MTPSQATLDFAQSAAVPVHDALKPFHPVVRAWFQQTLGDPSAPQIQAWPKIRAGETVLVAAPTGSGKTLAAFLACLDELFTLAARGELPDETRIVYVSPLKALGNDVQKNLLQPLEQLKERAAQAGLKLPEVRVAVRSGDTPAGERTAMVKKPPHILITTPESLYLYLTAGKARETLKSVRTLVVDEIHALARDKRGAHFALSAERLEELVGRPLQRIGLSATQKPLELLARFLSGTSRPCEVVHVGHLRPWELSLETPEDELSAVATHEMWGQIYDRLVALSQVNRTVLVFSNTRKLAERVAHDLGQRLGEDKVAAHHGSMSRELRLKAEDRLKSGELKVMVATASLELGLDIGSIDLVVQLGTPRSIAVMLQRLGRAGHRASAISRGVMFAMTRDELVECTALLKSIKDGELDAVRMPHEPHDVLAQQLVAEVAAREWDEASLFALVKRALPFEQLKEEDFLKVLNMVAEGVATNRGRSRVHLHHDRVNRQLKPRKGARLMALQNGGAIPDTFQYPVIAAPEDKQVGTLDEDYAVESMPGDVFVLGSTSWRITRIYNGEVRVENAHGAPPNVPFWRGEAPARTAELSSAVGRLRDEVIARDDAHPWLESLGLSARDADLLIRYLRAGVAALGAVPSETTVIAERFFDDAGGMQLIIHAPFGGRINRAWGLTLRKSFCRAFDFELQAAATDDGILLSLGEQHSFPLIDIFDFVHPSQVEKTLTQAVLQAPIFGTRFRWTATRSLALARMGQGKRVPPPIQRARSEDLIAAVFPEQVGCQDNHGGADLEPPDHPLVNETLKDCLRDAMDVDGLKEVLLKLKDGRIKKVAVDLPEPSVLAHAMLNSAPYTYLDEAPLEERRARAVSVRRTLPEADAKALGSLDAAAIRQVVEDARPELRDADELHDALLQFHLLPLEGCWPTGMGDDGPGEARVVASTAVPSSVDARQAGLKKGPPLDFDAEWVARLAAQKRLGVLETDGRRFLYAAERVPVIAALFPNCAVLPPLPGDLPKEAELAAKELVRGWLEVSGPITTAELAARLALPLGTIEMAFAKLELSGQVIRGFFRPDQPAERELEWCDRRLLQRIHRLTVGRLRSEIQPVSPQDFMRFLFRWHHLGEGSALRGPQGVAKVVELLQGYEAPAAAWEQELFPSRMRQYVGEWLEHLSFSGEVAWGRLTQKEHVVTQSPRRGVVLPKPFVPEQVVPPLESPVVSSSDEAASAGPRAKEVTRRVMPGRNASLTFVKRADLEWLLHAARPNALLADGPRELPAELSPVAREVAQALERRGACFFADLQASTRKLPAEIEDALWELLSRGVVTADAVQNLRVLQSPKLRKRQRATARGGPGRWSLLLPHEQPDKAELEERLARLFLQRYGIVFRTLLAREPLAPAWRDLLYVYRRLEARGEIRGGRFLNGFAGEQFALPEAVDLVRSTRRLPNKGEVIRVSAVDPLNLTGIVTPGARVPAVMGHEVVYVDGVPQELSAPQAAVAAVAGLSLQPLGAPEV